MRKVTTGRGGINGLTDYFALNQKKYGIFFDFRLFILSTSTTTTTCFIFVPFDFSDFRRQFIFDDCGNIFNFFVVNKILFGVKLDLQIKGKLNWKVFLAIRGFFSSPRIPNPSYLCFPLIFLSQYGRNVNTMKSK